MNVDLCILSQKSWLLYADIMIIEGYLQLW